MMLVKVFFLVIMVISMNGATLAMDSGDGERFGDGRRADYARGRAKRSLDARFAEVAESNSSDDEACMPKRVRKISIFDAIDDGDSDIVYQLIHQDIDLEETNGIGQTPLVFAAQEGYNDIVEHLLMHGASITHTDNNDYTALTYAAQNNDIEVLRVLSDYYHLQPTEEVEDEVNFALALVPAFIDGQYNIYHPEIIDMFTQSSAICMPQEHKKQIIKKILDAQKEIEHFTKNIEVMLPEVDCVYISQKQLKKKKLSSLRKRYKKIISVRDELVAQVTVLAVNKEKEGQGFEEREAEAISCFACCATLGGIGVQGVVLCNIPCPNECSGSNAYVCKECLPQLKDQCPYCQQKFKYKLVTA